MIILDVNEVTDDKEIIDNSDFIILPGVGKFDAAVKNLKERNLFDVLIKKARALIVVFLEFV